MMLINKFREGTPGNRWILQTIKIAGEEIQKLCKLEAESLRTNRGVDEFLRILISVWHESLLRSIGRRERDAATDIGTATGPMVEFVYACAEPVLKRYPRTKRRFTRHTVANAIRRHRKFFEN
jgi:hypothetical protein